MAPTFSSKLFIHCTTEFVNKVMNPLKCSVVYTALYEMSLFSNLCILIGISSEGSF